MHTLRNLWEWYHFVQGTILVKNRDVNIQYFGMVTPLWMVSKKAATKIEKTHICSFSAYDDLIFTYHSVRC